MRVPGWRHRLAGLLITAAVLAAGCDGEPSATPPPGTGAGAGDSATATVPPAAADKAKAQQVVLVAADLPGYTQDPPGTDEDDASFDAAANVCLNNNPLLLRLGEDDDERGAASPDFSRGENQTVGSSVTFGATDDETRSAFVDLNAPTFRDCFSNAIAERLRQDTRFRNLSVTTIKLPALGVGDENLGYRNTVRATLGGVAVALYLDFTFTRVGRAVFVVSGFSFDTPHHESERNRFVIAVHDRLKYG